MRNPRSYSLPRIVKDERGNIAIIFAMLVVPVTALTGAAVDYGHALMLRSQIQKAADAAVLAAGRVTGGDVGARRSAAIQAFSSNIPGNQVGSPRYSPIVPTISVDGSNVSVSASTTVQTNFMKLVRVDSISVSASSRASMTSKALELALMFDVTGSMNDNSASGRQKILEAKDAGQDLLNIVMPETGTRNTRMSLVPFSQRVKLDADTAAVITGQPKTRDVIGSAPCLHVMDQSGQGTFTLINSSNINASGCEVQVRSNHSSEAMSNWANSNLKFKRVQIKGETNSRSNITVMGAPYSIEEDAPVVGDPYNDAMQEVTSPGNLTLGGCSGANTNKTYNNVAVSPGTFCGTTTFNGVTFGAGLYVIKSNGGSKGKLRLTGQLTGGAVSFYLADNQSTITQFTPSSGTVLKAPTTGKTAGLLVFEDANRGSSWNLTVDSVSNQTWKGIVYLPSANLTISNTTSWASGGWNVSMELNRLTLDNVSGTWTPYTWTPDGEAGPVRLPGYTEYISPCTVERAGSSAAARYGDQAPATGDWTASYTTTPTADVSCPPNGSQGKGTVIGLTSDKARLSAAIANLQTGGNTAGHLGTAWALYTLSPHWNSIWNLPESISAYNNPGVIKAAVLMTDGQYNSTACGNNCPSSATQALALCQKLKDNGVQVWTIGFGMSTDENDPARQTLVQCADQNRYFFPYNGDELRAAFRMIGDQLMAAAAGARLMR